MLNYSLVGYAMPFDPVCIPDAATSISLLTLRVPSCCVYVVTPTHPAPLVLNAVSTPSKVSEVLLLMP